MHRSHNSFRSVGIAALLGGSLLASGYALALSVATFTTRAAGRTAVRTALVSEVIAVLLAIGYIRLSAFRFRWMLLVTLLPLLGSTAGNLARLVSA